MCRSRYAEWSKWDDIKFWDGAKGFGKRTVGQWIRPLKRWNLKISAIAKSALFLAASSSGHFWLVHSPRKRLSFYLMNRSRVWINQRKIYSPVRFAAWLMQAICLWYLTTT